MCHHPSVGKMCRHCVDWQLWCPGHRTSDCDSCWLTLPLPKTWRPPVTYHGHEGDGLTLHTMSKHWLCWSYKKQICMWSRGVRICENPLKVIGIFFINVQISITDLSTSSHSAVNVTRTALHQDRRDCHPFRLVHPPSLCRKKEVKPNIAWRQQSNMTTPDIISRRTNEPPVWNAS